MPWEGDLINPVDIERAEKIVDMAWVAMPARHRELLKAIGADQRNVAEDPLGSAVNALRMSAGLRRLRRDETRRLDDALGVWLPDLRLMLVRLNHPHYEGLRRETVEQFLARVAWHEWGHALSLDRATDLDIEAGSNLLDLSPDAIERGIRSAGYGRKEFTHELVAETYALLMGRRQRGESGKPKWLAEEIWEMMKRVTEWTE